MGKELGFEEDGAGMETGRGSWDAKLRARRLGNCVVGCRSVEEGERGGGDSKCLSETVLRHLITTRTRTPLRGPCRYSSVYRSG